MTIATTYTGPAASEGRRNRTWARRFWDRMIAARQEEANRRIVRHLRGFDDKALKARNLDDAAIARLRRDCRLFAD